MTLGGQHALCCRKDAYFGPHGPLHKFEWR